MKINQRAVIMRDVVQKLVPMLAQKRVQVTMRGTQAKVSYDTRTGEPVRLNVPYLADDAPDDLVDAIQGFVDHEVGHILKSDFEALKKGVDQGAMTAFLHNVIEDTYEEREMRATFPGTAFNLSVLSEFFQRSVVDPSLKQAIASGDPRQVNNVIMMPAMRAWAGDVEYGEYMLDKWEHAEQFRRLIGDDVIEQLPHVKSSHEGLVIAEEMVRRLHSLEKPSDPDEGDNEDRQAPSDKSDQRDEDAPKKSSRKEEGEGKDGDAPERPDGKPDEGDEGDEGKPEGLKDADPGDDGDDGDDGSSGQDDQGDDQGPSEDGKGEGEEQGTEGNLRPEMNSGIPENFVSAVPDDFDDQVADALSARAAQVARTSDYLVFTRDCDVIAPMPTSATSVDLLPRMHEEVDAMLGPMAKDIERMIQARSAAVWTGGHRRGRLHGAALHKINFGRDDLFRRKQENHTKDVAVSLVVDCSGSMAGAGGQKLKIACWTAFALASVLERLNIAVEVSGFTTRPHSPEVMEEMRHDPLLHEYARYEALYLPIFKAFDERLTKDIKARFTYPVTARDLCNSNVDGESVLLAANRLSARREARKIMMVLSDGQPAVLGNGDLESHLKAVITNIEKAGIDVVGIGILDESVRSFYKRNVMLNNLADLPAVVMGQLKTLLLK